MSSPSKYTLSLTKEAEEDFIDILVYTLKEWGQEKQKEYDASICHVIRHFLKLFLAISYPSHWPNRFVLGQQQSPLIS